ncbi:PilW family protein [Pseudoxanthomonas suwonensis]
MKRPSRSRMLGMSLLELMIAVLIGTILLIGLVQVFNASRAAYQLSEGMGRVQENARFAMDYLQRDLRMAGHYGCVNDQSHLQVPGALVTHFGAAPPFGLDFGTSVVGYDADGTAPGDVLELGSEATTWTPALPAAVAGLNPLPGSDIVVLRYLSSSGAPLTAMSAGGDSISVPVARWGALTQDGVANPTLFGVADCSHVDIFQGVANGSGTVTLDPSVGLIERYTVQPAGQTMLHRAESLVYYVGTGAGGGPSLFRARFNGAAYVPEELVEGVENLQLLFGQDQVVDLGAAAPSGFMAFQNPASAITNTEPHWRRVGMVEVGLLVRSPDAAASADPEEVNRKTALGVVFDPTGAADRRFRDSYETTVALRNRLYGN